jgi:TonB-dependent receptor
MGTNLIRAMLLASGSASIALAAFPAAAYAQDASYQIDIPAQLLGDALRALGRATKQNIVFDGAVVRGKRSAAVQGRLTAGEALQAMLSGSGLVMSRGSGGALTVRAGNASGAASGGAQQAQGQATLVGSVRDHKTGAALKGARVEVVGTGASTSTGDLGDFRFTRLPTGDVTLRVSYLGFPEQTETVSMVGGLNNRTDIYLGSGATSEIVVIGQVSARAQALNQERTAENSTTVISGDLLGNFNGTTISDSLRRAPGVAFQQDSFTGDGTNIIVRGLAADYNQVSLNGVALPEGTGLGRSADLSAILSDSISNIKISKTLLANQDSYGTGGLVEIETKSPLDRPKRYFNFSADGTKYGKGFGNEYLLSGTASVRFGADENFGISGSVQYRRQDRTSYSYGVDGVYGAYAPLAANGLPVPPFALDPRMLFPFYEGAEYQVRSVNVNSVESAAKNRNIGITAEWQVSPGTNLRLDFVRSNRTSEIFDNRYTIQAESANYVLAPVPALGGAQRYVFANLGDEIIATSNTSLSKDKSRTDTVSFRGESAFGPLKLNYNAGYSKGKTDRPYSGALSLGSFPGVLINDQNFRPDIFNADIGRVGSLFGPRIGRSIPAPLLTSAGFEQLRTSAISRFRNYNSEMDGGGFSRNWSGEISGKYEFGSGILKYVEAGLEYRRSDFDSQQARSLGYQGILDANGLPVPLEQIGIEFENLPFSTGSGDQLYRLVTRKSFEGLIGRLAGFAADGLLEPGGSDPDPLLDGQGTQEDALVGYLQARADIGKLEIIAGVRVDRSRVKARFLNSDTIFDENFGFDLDFFLERLQVYNKSDTLTTILPRILVNYRPQENIVVRAGYYSTVARPQIDQLNKSTNLTYYAAPFFGPAGTQPLLTIQSGNPALKPAWTHNFDLSAEWYDGKVGVVKLAAFYKRINNLIESNSVLGFNSLGDYELPDHPLLNNLPSDVIVEVSYPSNNPDPGIVWGVEAAFERQLNFLPGVLSGLGIYANYTYTRSKKIQPLSYLVPVYDDNQNIVSYESAPYEVTLPFDGSPRHSGTVGLTYTRPGFDGSLYYTTQARRQAGGGAPFGMDTYTEAVSTLDLRAVYQFKLQGSDVRLSFEGRDLLRNQSDPSFVSTIGGVRNVPKIYRSGSYLGGRKFSLGLSVTF